MALLKLWILLALPVTASLAFAHEEVDVAVVLATDVSGSVSDGPNESEYRLQKDGIALGLRDPELAQILEACNGSGLALTYMEWSGQGAFNKPSRSSAGANSRLEPTCSLLRTSWTR